MADPQVASKLTPSEWGAQFRANNPNYHRFQTLSDEDFAAAMRNNKVGQNLDIENLVDFNQHSSVKPDNNWFNPLQWGTEKPSHVMVNGDITPVGSHIFGEDSKAVYTGARFLSGIPSFLTGVVAGGFDEQSAYDIITQTIKKDSNGNPIFDENGMMDYIDGSGNVHKVTQEDMLERADKLRSKSFLPFGIGPNWKEAEEYLTGKTIDFWTEHNKRMDDYLANNPGVQGYLQWQKETPFSYEDHGVRQFVHPQMIARAVADMLPSMTVSTLLSGGASVGVQGLKTLAGQQTLKQAAANTSVSGLAQVGAMTLMEGSGQMEEALNILINDLKMDPGQAVPIASSTALVVGIVNGLLEKLQFTKIAKYGKFDDEAKTLLTNTIVKRFYDDAMKAGGVRKWMLQSGDFLVDNIEEGVIEAMQEMNGLAMNKGLEAGLGTTPEEVISNYKKQFTSFNNLKEMATSPEVMQAFFTGFSGGGGMAAGTRAGGYLMNKIGGGDKVSASYDDSDGKPGIMTNVGGRISKIFTKSKEEANTIMETLEESGATEGLSIPGLGKGIEEISTFKDLLIAMADQINNGTSIALEWDELSSNISKNPEDLSEAQQILVKMNKRFDQFGAHANLVIQDIIDKAGIEVLDQIEDGDIKSLIVEQIKTVQKEKIKAGVKTSLDPDVQEAAIEEYLDKQFADDKDFMNIYNNEGEFDKQLQEHLMTLDPEALYQNQKPIGQVQASKEKVAAERNARVKQVFQDPNGNWSVNDLVEAARVAVGNRGMKGLKSFLGGTKGGKKKPGFRGLTKKNLSRLMQAYGIKHSPAMKRGDMIDSLIKKMMGEAVSEINIKTKQAQQETEKPTEKPKTKAQKMAGFFGEDDTETDTTVEDEASKIDQEISKLEQNREQAIKRLEKTGSPNDEQLVSRLDMAIGGLRNKLKQLELGTEPKPKVEEKPKKEKITEEEVKTDTGESITITPTGDEITPDSAVMKGMKDVAADDAATFAKEEDFTEDDYDNIEEDTEDLSDVINKCGRGI
jgi:hypothetical protein